MKGDAYGNIYVNSDCEFEVAIVKGSGSTAEIHKLGVLKKDPDKPWAYRMDYSESAMYDRDGYNLKRGKKDYMGNRLSLTPEGMVTGSFGGTSDFRLAIRPVNSASARPGDDLLLQLGIRSKDKTEADVYTDSTTGKVFSKVATMKESDYIAVYDKKILWRANLYIDEGGEDWNKIHPWNAPPIGETQVVDDKGLLNPIAQISPWWSEERGYNDWNRQYKDKNVFKSMVDLNTGDGKQVVSMPTTLWWENANPDVTRINTKTLAYDYWGWDSPFSFTKKINEQELILNQWYTTQGLRFQKPVNEWRIGDPDSWSMTEDEKITILKSYLPNINEYQGSSVSLSSLRSFFLSFRDTSSNRWNSTQPHAKTTKNYARGPAYDKYDVWFKGTLLDSAFELRTMPGTINGTELHPYVPGLSNELGATTTRETDGTSYLEQFAAGADCIGFVQGSLSYSGVTYQAMTAATRMVIPSYWDAVGTRLAVDGNAMKDLNSAQSFLITNLKTVADDGVVTELGKIVPGDIFYYYNNGHHIAIVAEIDSSLFASDVLKKKLQAIKIIESTHNISLGVFGVGKTSNLSVYSGGATARSWQIRRMK